MEDYMKQVSFSELLSLHCEVPILQVRKVHQSSSAMLFSPSVAVLSPRTANFALTVLRLREENKSVFKIEESKRKFRTHTRKLVFKNCKCCGKDVFKHKCPHNLCEQQCRKYMKAMRLKEHKVNTMSKDSEHDHNQSQSHQEEEEIVVEGMLQDQQQESQISKRQIEKKQNQEEEKQINQMQYLQQKQKMQQQN